MRKMSPAISVFRKQSELQILLGSVVDIYQTAGLSANHQIASGGEMMVGPGGNLLMPDPVYVFPSNYSYSSYSSRKSVSFLLSWMYLLIFIIMGQYRNTHMIILLNTQITCPVVMV